MQGQKFYPSPVILTIWLLFLINCQYKYSCAIDLYLSRQALAARPPSILDSTMTKVAVPTGIGGTKEYYCRPDEISALGTSTSCEKENSNLQTTPHHLDGMTTPEIIQSYGYSSQTYHVKTKDGYILTVYRIVEPSNRSHVKTKKRPVYLNHGMCSASDLYFLQPKDKALPIVLAKNGFDVFLSNARGSTYSLGHEKLDQDKDWRQYWDFSFHEMGIYDLPAVTNLILKTTGFKRTLYIGYSMGTTQALIGLSEVPELNNKISAAFLLAPTAYLGHTTNSVRVLARKLHSYEAYQVVSTATQGRFRDSAQLRQTFGLFASDTCAPSAARCGMCDNALFAMFGYNAPQMNRTELPNFLKRFPNLASVKIASHYAQFINSCKFQKYNYSPLLNMKIYGSRDPPEYNLANIKTNIYMYYSQNDNMDRPIDVNRSASQIRPQYLKRYYLVQDEMFTHMDFALAKDAKTLVYDQLISDMKKSQ